MLLAVMDAGKSGHMVHNRDSLGFTPMDHLCLNRIPISSEGNGRPGRAYLLRVEVGDQSLCAVACTL
eukprot:scaffold4119_cov50-Cylindrotheca_fusiformis.AAC.1